MDNACVAIWGYRVGRQCQRAIAFENNFPWQLFDPFQYCYSRLIFVLISFLLHHLKKKKKQSNVNISQSRSHCLEKSLSTWTTRLNTRIKSSFCLIPINTWCIGHTATKTPQMFTEGICHITSGSTCFQNQKAT